MGGVNTCKRHQSTDQTRPNQLSPHHACGRMWVAWISPYITPSLGRDVPTRKASTGEREDPLTRRGARRRAGWWAGEGEGKKG